jgi:lipooligosaccharide transport system ATP-binding protein
MDEAFQLCDRLLIMPRGEKVLQGNPTELIDREIEPYVLEIFDVENAPNLKQSKTIRIETTENRALLYSRDLHALEKTSKRLNAGNFFLRQSNLEDIFLKVTGRGLNE